MNGYTVEITTAPVMDDDWTVLHRVIDAVPGTLLIEDPEAPVLVIPVESETPMRAALFVDGVTKLIGIEVVSGAVGPEPDVDFDLDGDPETRADSAPVVDAVHVWMAGVHPIAGHVNDDGRLISR